MNGSDFNIITMGSDVPAISVGLAMHFKLHLVVTVDVSRATVLFHLSLFL